MAAQRFALQFTMRQMFVTVALASVVVGLIVWDARWGPIVSAGLVALALIVLGLTKRRKSLVASGFAILMVGGGLLYYHSRYVVAWCGWAKLDVYVLVIDTDTFQPVVGAKIEVLNGPFSPLEAPISSALMSAFAPARMEPGIGKLITDSRGACNFPHRFFAWGTDGLFHQSGYVDTGRNWLEVSAPGRGSVIIPLDRQSCHARDIKDKAPLFVTVPLRKQSDG